MGKIEMKHTPEPWGLIDRYSSMIFDNEGNGVFDGIGEHDNHAANSRRAVECVNAMVGIEDPERFIKNARELAQSERNLKLLNAELLSALERVKAEMVKSSHVRPSFWIADFLNGYGAKAINKAKEQR